ncbi:MAG: hypothetical protein JXR91_13640, partial [Deltaproteobacteria bacterium]|nr:hypothetical protein [Deltaproteobacteria bacterium]
MSINQINYELLFEDIAGFYEVIGVNSSKNRNKNALEAYWNIGNRIASMEKSVSRSEIYGKEVVKRLSQDLNKKFGTGFGMRNIFYMRSLARDYDKQTLNPELTWNHYKLLLMVEDTEQRVLLEKMTAEQHVTTKKLAQLIKQVSRGDKLADGNIFLLHPREARTGIYKVVKDYKGNVLLDLGFNVLHKTKINGVRGLKQGDYIECVDGGQQYKRVV